MIECLSGVFNFLNKFKGDVLSHVLGDLRTTLSFDDLLRELIGLREYNLT